MEKKTILVVDDDREQLKGLSIRLKANGYHVAVASDCVQVTSVVRKVHPDLVLLDLGLPGGDGFLVLERLDKLNLLATMPVIVVSARDQAGNEQKALDAGAEAFLQKPVDNEKLIAVIRKTLGEEDGSQLQYASAQ
jgi:two-component system KDP operon response regulator KdpE